MSSEEAKRKKLRAQTEWIALSCVLVGFAVGIALLLAFEHKTIETNEIDRLQVQARVVGENVVRQLEGVSNALNGARDEFATTRQSANGGALSDHLKLLTDAMPGVRTMLVYDELGVVAASSRSEFIGRQYSKRRHFDEPRLHPDREAFYISPPFLSSLGPLVVSVGRVVLRPNGELIGVAEAILDPEYFDVVLSSVLYAPDMRATLFYAEGKAFITAPPNSSVLAATSLLHPTVLQPDAVSIEQAAKDAEPRLVISRIISRPDLHINKPFVIAVSREVSAIYLPWRTHVLEYGMFYTVLALTALGFLYVGQWRRRAFEQLEAATAYERQQSAEQLRLVIDHMPALISYVDRDQKFLFANCAYRDWLDVEPATLIGCSVADLYQGKAYANFRERIESAMRGEVTIFECGIATIRGQRYVEVSAVPQRDSAGDVQGLCVLMHDLTDRRNAELRLIETSSLLHTLLGAVSEISIIATDPFLVITVFNTGAERLLGYTSEELVGRATTALIHDADEVNQRAEEVSAELGRPVDGIAAFTEECTLRRSREWIYVRKDGERITVSLVVNAMRADDGQLLGYVGVAHDMTERKRYEESLRDARFKAEQANRAKTEFLANMSHELRSPMNAVIGLSYLLGSTGLNAEQAGFLDKIKLASKSLTAVVNDVLDLSKIEAGELMFERAPFNPSALLTELAQVMAVQADAKNIRFEVDITPDLPEALDGDAMRLNQILTNLLSNAIKFTARGSVRLCVRLLAATPKRATLYFSVQDTGIGIAPEVQATLFAPFAQADASITRRFGGTGLGLSIVKRLTDLMGGEVSLDSTAGVGSEFKVILDFAPAAAEALATIQAPSVGQGQCALPGIRVLVVDDSDINLEVTQRILELEGASVALASNGLEAFERLRNEPDAFDVVLMDVHMPVLNGHDATRRIRSELPLKALPIIALTAGALSSERQRAAEAGMDDFLIKPFDAQALVFGILRHVKAKQDKPATQAKTLATGVPAVAAQWPDIEGIDAIDAQLRLGNDVALFRSIIKRLLDEFAGLTFQAPHDDAPKLAARTGLLHKLKGSAGMVGAKSIHALASQAEAACTAGKLQLTDQLAVTLVAELRQLQTNAAPMLEAARRESESALPSLVPVDAQAFSELIHALRQQNLAALERFSAMAPQLRGVLGKESFDIVRALMDKLKFSDVAATLEALQQ